MKSAPSAMARRKEASVLSGRSPLAPRWPMISGDFLKPWWKSGAAAQAGVGGGRAASAPAAAAVAPSVRRVMSMAFPLPVVGDSQSLGRGGVNCRAALLRRLAQAFQD